MTDRTLKWAGFLAMTSAVLGIPVLILSYYLSERDDLLAHALQATMHLAGLMLFICLASFLKRLLNTRHSFHEVDNYIDFLITINLVLCTAVIAALFLPSLEGPLNLYSILLIVAFGVGHLFLGFKLLKLSDSLKGMLKPYCLFTIATGILISSVVLMSYGAITGAIADVMLGTIFFQAVKKPEAPTTG